MPCASLTLWCNEVWFAIVVLSLNPFSFWVFVNNFMEVNIGIMSHKNAILFSAYIVVKEESK